MSAMNAKLNATTPGWKRILDRTLICLALPVVLPVSALVALWVRCVSKGPVFFRQERVGYLGKRFTIIKFRTMCAGADTRVHEGHTARLMKSGGKLVKLDATDSRIIPFGKWIRAAGLDELPQLINVWRGDMSLVGPRPCVVAEFEKYQNWQMERFNTLPGLTGLWQVNGKNNTTFEEMIQFDIEYSRNQAVALDLEIMFRTLPALAAQVREMRQNRGGQALPMLRPIPQAGFSL